MSDFLIVGGGLIGLLTARNLIETGATVTLIERGQLGQESSWAGGGILSPLYPWKYPPAVNALALWGQKRYQQLAAELEEATGIDSEWVKSGLLIVDDEEIQPAFSWGASASAKVISVDADEIYQLEPALGHTHASGAWMPDVAQIRNPRLMKALKKDLLARGLRLAENTEVVQLLTKRGRIQGVGTEYNEVIADKVIIACGAWSASLLRDLGNEISVMPIRGQMILFRSPPGTLKRIVLSGGHYIIPRKDGLVLVGSTMEDVGFDKSVTEEARNELAEIARYLIPSLKNARLENHWAGLRPGSPAGVPYIGAHPKVEGLYINTGHFRNGVAMGPASAQLMADIILDRPCSLDPEPYALVERANVA